MPEKVGELVKEQKVQRGSTLYKYFFVVVAMELATGVASDAVRSVKNKLLKKYLLHVFILCDVGMITPQRNCGGQRTSCGSRLSPSALWVLDSELRWSGLEALGRLTSQVTVEDMPTVTSTVWLLWKCKVYTFSSKSSVS